MAVVVKVRSLSEGCMDVVVKVRSLSEGCMDVVVKVPSLSEGCSYFIIINICLFRALQLSFTFSELLC